MAEHRTPFLHADHLTPFLHADHLTPLISSLFPKDDSCKNIKLERTKAQYIMEDGIAFHERRFLAEKLRKTKFTILLDESTDKSVSQILAVVVRYFDDEKSKVKDSLLGVIEVDNSTAAAAGLYKLVKKLLHDVDIPLANVIGLGADNCATMMGSSNGFQALIKMDVPNIFVQGCICHSMALCANHAAKTVAVLVGGRTTRWRSLF